MYRLSNSLLENFQLSHGLQQSVRFVEKRNIYKRFGVQIYVSVWKAYIQSDISKILLGTVC